MPQIKNQENSFAAIITFDQNKSGVKASKKGKRYTQYIIKDDELKAEMLYDHEKNPAGNDNVADQKQYSGEIGQFSYKIDCIRNTNLLK